MEKRTSVDAGYHKFNVHPADKEGCVGTCGIDKTFTLERVMSIAYRMPEKPNIIIKAGKNAKWYLKCIPHDTLDREIEKQQWRNTSRCTMWIIEWDDDTVE